ncbi:MAG: GDP-mannose 4,6-dehydratase, partial [Gemmatimonadales bacterium]|nr:GDP-mannose 4,6-dehydratase [Gemmatimonadales bacterium]
NLDARRDWGYAGDYVDAMWRMLQQPEPEDYVIGTGVQHSVRDCCQVAFAHLGLDWQRHVEHDARYDRPAEVDLLLANPSKARTRLGWMPVVSFEQLIKMMVDADLARLQGKS